MKWLKMDCDAQENLDMRKLIDEWGWDWYGRLWAIYGKVGMLVTENCQTFALQTNNGQSFPVKLLANDLQTNVERLTNFCNYLADNNLIDNESWYSKNLIYVPKLKERADEYTRKLLTKSGQNPKKVHLEEEIEIDKKENSNILGKSRYGSGNNVLLSDIELDDWKLKAGKDYWEWGIEQLSLWKINKPGERIVSDLAKLKGWVLREIEKRKKEDERAKTNIRNNKSSQQQRAEFSITKSESIESLGKFEESLADIDRKRMQRTKPD